MSDSEQEDHLSEAEFEAAEDRMDHQAYESRTHDLSATGFTAWQRQRGRQARAVGLAMLVLAAVVLTLVVTNSGAAPRPSCSPHSSGCRRSSDGHWIPQWYFSALVAAQGTPKGQAPLSVGTQPTVYELYHVRATPGEIQEALHYANRIGQSSQPNGSGLSGTP